jgi:pilus assembly protein CpaC
MSAVKAKPGDATPAWRAGLKHRSLRQILAGAVAGCAFLQSSLHAQQGLPNAMAPIAPSRTQSLQLEDTSLSGRVDAAHSPNIEHMLKPAYLLEIERRHSQLVITGKRVRRIAVTDSNIVNYVQYSETEISIVGLELGKTDLTLWFEDDDKPSIYEVSVVRDASLEEQRQTDFGKLERRLRTLFPNSQVALIPVGSQVLVRGQAYDGEEAQNILQIVRTEVFRTFGRNNDLDDGLGGNALTGGGAFGGGGVNQNNRNNGNGIQFRDIVINELIIPGEFNVKMRVLVAEINRSELRNAGVDWRVFFNDGRHNVGSTLGGASGTTLSGIFENGEIQIFVRWLQSNGTIKLLAEPQIVTISGTAASILAGGEFAVPTIIGLGGGQATSFRGFGTSLVVTPTIMDRDLIRLQVIPEFSELNTANAVDGIPGTNVKRVQTTVELREGQTFAIGGLISRQTSAQTSRIPLLGDIPWIGPRVFQSKNASEIETELLVLVSPEIVRPMEPDEVPPVPGYNATHPTDHELWYRGQTEGQPDNQVYQIAPFGSGVMHGEPVGYSLFNPAVTHGGFTPGPGLMDGRSNGAPGMYDGSANGSPPPGMPPSQQLSAPMGPEGSQLPQQQFQPYSGQPYPGQSYPQPHLNQSYPNQPYPTSPPPVPAPPSNYVPQPIPSSQLPPSPGPYPGQAGISQQGDGVQQKPSMLSRVSSVFRKNEQPEKTPTKPATWSRTIN